jgi:hypothetical protein
MTLKTATKIAMISISVNLLLALANSYPFRFFLALELETFYTIFGIVQLATLHVPLIIFFVVLYRKQK